MLGCSGVFSVLNRFRPSGVHLPRYLLPTLLLLLAAYFRFHQLETQSLWNDEGNSLRLAQRSVGDLIDAVGRDIHPPGYYLLLKGWISLAGTSEFSLRAVSAFQGLLTVAITITLGRKLFSRSAGLIAGLVVVINASAVYYSQETRMYAQLALLSAASMWALMDFLSPHPPAPSPTRRDGGRSRAWAWPLTLSLCNAAGLYTHYSYAFTLAAQGVILALWMIGRRVDSAARRVLLRAIALYGLTLLLFLPWLPTAWDQIMTWPRTGLDLSLTERLHTMLAWIIYGNTAGDIPWVNLIWPGALMLAGVWPIRWRRTMALIWGGITVMALVVSGAYREANLKFLLPAQIAAALLMGGGVWQLWGYATRTRRSASLQPRFIAHLIAGVSLFLIVIGQLEALNTLYTDPVYARDNYRAIAALIMAEPRSGDAIILDAPNQAEVFTYYYQGDAPIYELPRGLGGDDDQTRAEVQNVIAMHRRIFVLFWGEEERDPRRVVQTTLDIEAYPVFSEWYGDVRLAQYAVLQETPETPQVIATTRFGEQITLSGYALSTNTAQSGDVLGVTLFWQTDVPLDTRYKVTVQLLAPDGSLVSQHDAEPGNNRALTTTWTPHRMVTDSHGLIIPPGTPPGLYTIIVGLYDINAPMNRLLVTADGASPSDHLSISIVKIS